MGLSSMFRTNALGKVGKSLNRLFTGIARGIMGDYGQQILNSNELGAPERAGGTGNYQVSKQGEAAMERKGLPGALRANIRAELAQKIFEGAYTVEAEIRQLRDGGYRMNYRDSFETGGWKGRRDGDFKEGPVTTISFDKNGERLDGKKSPRLASQTRVPGLGQTA